MTSDVRRRIGERRAAWVVLTTAVLGLAGAHLLLNLAAVILRVVHRRAIGDAMAGSAAAIGRIGSLGSVLTVLDAILLVLTVLGVGTLIVWAFVVRGLHVRHGADLGPLRQRVFVVALGLAIVQLALNGVSGLIQGGDTYQVVSASGRAVDLTQIVAGTMRMAIAVLVAYGARAVRGRVLGVLMPRGDNRAPSGPVWSRDNIIHPPTYSDE
jgi:hypothetical protein